MIEQSNDNENAAKAIKMLNMQPKIKLRGNWRPNNWVNRQKDFMEMNIGVTRAYFKNGMEEYEHGASAMLPARDKWWIEQIESKFKVELDDSMLCTNQYCNSHLGEEKQCEILCLFYKWQMLRKSVLE